MRPLLATMILLLATTVAHGEEWVIKSSPHDVPTTADRLEAAVEESPATLVARVDHQAAAMDAGLEMNPATVLVFGNPALGTPLMQADPRAALDLPLRVLIWESEDGTSIGYLAVEALAARYDIENTEETLGSIEQALDALTGKAVAVE